MVAIKPLSFPDIAEDSSYRRQKQQTSRKTKKQLVQELYEYKAAVLKLPIISYQSTLYRRILNKAHKLVTKRHASASDIAEAATLMLSLHNMPSPVTFNWIDDVRLRLGLPPLPTKALSPNEAQALIRKIDLEGIE